MRAALWHLYAPASRVAAAGDSLGRVAMPLPAVEWMKRDAGACVFGTRGRPWARRVVIGPGPLARSCPREKDELGESTCRQLHIAVSQSSRTHGDITLSGPAVDCPAVAGWCFECM